ncbi:hypothetical protein [Swingsia samuiensis]|uniref:Uncharacterized protein n=1 Tax=Swingsia samuiensis TaxID=1293412 RepID=A0A4Y6UII0_9PROT|nr:hypothetical protein [Swingsia samuiensis]QDH17429.1 hypothetical protein E3D00_07520 [Swingsia samuiensis]
MSARQWGKFWWQDWQRDPALRMCSIAARGLWMDMLCLMHDANPQGHLLVNGKQPTIRQMAVIFGATSDEVSSAISELEEAGVFSKTDDGVIFSRRMVREKTASEEAYNNGKKGGNPALKRKRKPSKKQGVNLSEESGVNPPLNPNTQEGVNPPVNLDCTKGLSSTRIKAEAEAEAEAEADISSLRSDIEREGDFRNENLPAPAEATKPKSKRGCRLPDDWWPSEELIQFAVDNQVDPEQTAETFRDYWHGV